MTAITWNLRLALKDGQRSNFEDLMREMVMSTTKETGCQTYDWYITADGFEVHILERYTDAEATMLHLTNFGAHFADRFFACVTPKDFTVYGHANDDIRGALGPLGATFMGPMGGFRR